MYKGFVNVLLILARFYRSMVVKFKKIDVMKMIKQAALVAGIFAAGLSKCSEC